MTGIALGRRVLATRDTGWARHLAHALGRAGATPNSVSIAGLGWAFAACSAFAIAPAFSGAAAAAVLVIAAAAIQLRLLCNLLDGMLAVEEGLKTPLGELYNEIPDRIADAVILVGAGAAVRDVPGGLAIGCAAAMAALFTAYVRVLGGSLGVTQHFTGPMAKQHRMFVLTIAALIGAGEVALDLPGRALLAALSVITIGAIATAWRRVRLIAAELEVR
jgi:phosphatidylglycerophosphate synthase